jgi:N-methylhydantoinase A/acetone carboxylase, beta subunit
MKIFGELSKKVIEDKIAKKLNMNVITASEGIIRIINNIMAKSISIMSIERGRDPREFSIIAFGGAGPMHACELADEIGIKEIIVPPHPGLFSAYGLLTVDIVKVFSSSVFDKDLDKVLIELKNNAIEDFKKEGVENVEFEEFIDVRYKGQSYEITLKYEGKPNIREQFDKEHKKLYGYSSKDPIEIVSVKVLAIAKIPKIEIAESRRNKDKIEIISKRKVYFNGESYEIPIYSRNAIDVGFEGKGPAIIEEYDSTIVINPNWKWFVDKYLNIILSR